MKKCKRCKVIKDESEFYYRPDHGTYRSICIKCFLEQNRGKYKKPTQELNRQQRYGVDNSIYQTLYQSQNGACKICGKIVANLSIDHNHTTGAIRGLLCHSCNSAIGLLDDNTLLLKKAINYLETANTKTTLQQHLMQMLRR